LAFTNDELIAAVAALREKYGACSTGMLADNFACSRVYAHRRVRDLVDAGKLLITPDIHGSIRLAPPPDDGLDEYMQ
jgi:hypothetical protein